MKNLERLVLFYLRPLIMDPLQLAYQSVVEVDNVICHQGTTLTCVKLGVL